MLREGAKQPDLQRGGLVRLPDEPETKDGNLPPCGDPGGRLLDHECANAVRPVPRPGGARGPGRPGKGEEHDLLAGHRANVVVQAQRLNASDILDQRVQERQSPPSSRAGPVSPLLCGEESLLGLVTAAPAGIGRRGAAGVRQCERRASRRRGAARRPPQGYRFMRNWMRTSIQPGSK